MLTFFVKGPGSTDILLAMDARYTQILLSKYYIPLKGIRTPWRNN